VYACCAIPYRHSARALDPKMKLLRRPALARTVDMQQQLRDTQDAFDSVAADYDGPRGNNELIQNMRAEMWRWLDATFVAGSRLIDLGCGTGLDAIRMAQRGYRITATDWSPKMIERTRDRAERERVTDAVETIAVGAHELHRIEGQGLFDGAYSDLGALNCVPELSEVSRQCARLLKEGGKLVFTVIGRICPWEIGHYLLRGDWTRAKVRFARGMVPVRLNKRIVWANYYTPRQLYHFFEPHFSLTHYRGLCTFAPPPYLTWVSEGHRRWYEWLWRTDRRTAGWAVLRNLGDHFLIVMTKR
jgi:ubiquinone/menaquinone biosynthesis C-methylase UbiE